MIISRISDTDNDNVASHGPISKGLDAAFPDISLNVTVESHRLALSHWLEVKGDGKLPARADLNLALLAPILPQIVLLDVKRDPLDFVYRIIGDKLLSHFTENYSGKALSEISGKGPGTNVFENLANIATIAQPRIQGIPYVGPNRDFVRIESLALPLASDHEKIDKIMIVVEFIAST